HESSAVDRVPEHPPPHARLPGGRGAGRTAARHVAHRRQPRGSRSGDRRRHHGRRDPTLSGPRAGGPARDARHARRTAGRLAGATWRRKTQGRRRRHATMVSFKPTDEQDLISKTMADFAREVLRPHAREADEANRVPDEVVARGWELGFVEREKNMGIKALDTYPLRLDGVRVPVASRLGGDATDVQPLVDASRVATAALAVGVSRAAFDHARDYAKERRAFGQSIAQKQAI